MNRDDWDEDMFVVDDTYYTEQKDNTIMNKITRYSFLFFSLSILITLITVLYCRMITFHYTRNTAYIPFIVIAIVFFVGRALIDSEVMIGIYAVYVILPIVVGYTLSSYFGFWLKDEIAGIMICAFMECIGITVYSFRSNFDYLSYNAAACVTISGIISFVIYAIIFGVIANTLAVGIGVVLISFMIYYNSTRVRAAVNNHSGLSELERGIIGSMEMYLAPLEGITNMF